MITLICMWILFTRADVPGWNALIPFLNTYRFFEMTYGNGWLMFLTLIPFFGQAFLIVTVFRFFRTFDAPVPFAIFGVIIPFFFLLIMVVKGWEFQGYDDVSFKVPLIATAILLAASIAVMQTGLIQKAAGIKPAVTTEKTEKKETKKEKKKSSDKKSTDKKSAEKKSESTKKKEEKIPDTACQVRTGEINTVSIKYPVFIYDDKKKERVAQKEGVIASYGELVTVTISIVNGYDLGAIDNDFKEPADTLNETEGLIAKALINKKGDDRDCKAVLLQQMQDKEHMVKVVIEEKTTEKANLARAQFEWNKSLEVYGLSYTWY